jgi:hypothetical protein
MQQARERKNPQRPKFTFEAGISDRPVIILSIARLALQAEQKRSVLAVAPPGQADGSFRKLGGVCAKIQSYFPHKSLPGRHAAL